MVLITLKKYEKTYIYETQLTNLLLSETRKLHIVILGTVIFNFLCIITGCFLKSSFYWGFNLLSFFPLYQVVLILLLGSVIFIPKFQEFIFNSLNKSEKYFKREYIPALIIIFYTAFFIIFRIKVHFLGDGPMILRMLPEMTGVSDMITTNEPGAYALDLFIQSLLRHLMKSSYNPNMVYLLLSYVTGILFLLVLLKYVRSMPVEFPYKVLTFIVLFFTSSIIFYLGYVETYQIVYLMMLLFLVFSILYFRNKINNSYISSLVFGFWLSLHYLAAVFFPSYIILLVYNFRKDKLKSILSLMLFLICFLLGFIYTGLDFNEMVQRFIAPNESHWLPLFSHGGSDIIPALSPSHLWDVLNSQFLVLPFGLLSLILFIVLLYKLIKWKDAGVLFLAVMSLCSVIFIFLFNSYMGLSRDWDVVALMSYPFLFFFIYVINNSFEHHSIKKLYSILAYIGLWQTMIWVFLNWNVEISEKRNTHLDNDRLWEKDKLAIYFEELGAYYRNKGDYSTAQEKYKQGLIYAPNSERLVLNLSSIYQKEANLKQAEILVNSSIKNGNKSRKIFFELGTIEINSGNYDKAIQIFENILMNSPDDFEALGNIATCYYFLKDYEKSIKYSNKVIRLVPDLPLPYIGLGDCYLSNGDTVKANSNYLKAKELDTDNRYKNKIDEELLKIRK